MTLHNPNQPFRWAGPLALVLGLMLSFGMDGAAFGGSGTASGLPPAEKPAPDIDTLQQRDQELESIRKRQQEAADAEAKLRQQIEALGADRRKFNEQLIGTAARIRTIETSIASAEGRLKPLAANELAIRKTLESRRSVIAEVLAALQRMGRRPPPALMVRPEDALASVRSAIMLGAVLPPMREEATALAGDLADLVRVRRQIAEQRDRLRGDLMTIDQDRKRLALLVEQREKQQAETEGALAAARERATGLARDADNLQDLIAKLEKGLDPKARAARLASRGKDGQPGSASPTDAGRMAPAIAFASAKHLLPLPVNGIKVREFGAPDGIGGAEKGLSLATRGAAQVTSPCDGWVVYAGPFRSYGQLLILDAGGGYHVLLAGMARISVNISQFVLTGEPIAAMGSGPQVATLLDAGSSQPVLYVEFRKDGTPIDPSPWWAASEGEKVRG